MKRETIAAIVMWERKARYTQAAPKQSAKNNVR
jgi:hypothetical protein